MRTERKPEHSYGRQFMVVFPSALQAIACDPKATAPTLKVLLWAWQNFSFETWKQIHQSEVGAEIGVTAASVSRGLAYLREAGIVERQGAGARQQWRLTPEAGWKGTAGSYQRARRERGEIAEGKRPRPPMLRVVREEPADA